MTDLALLINKYWNPTNIKCKGNKNDMISAEFFDMLNPNFSIHFMLSIQSRKLFDLGIDKMRIWSSLKKILSCLHEKDKYTM